MFYDESKLSVYSPTRHEKDISQVAENVIVVTAREIEAMNAHTLSDVLRVLTGVQLEEKDAPWTSLFVKVQGSDARHVLVLIDGVVQNNLTDNLADVGAILVQNIEKIEIIKGPASSSWGSALGGVINIITKPAGNTLKPDISLRGSYGTADTSDIRADISGKVSRVGYYLYAGKLKSDGFTGNTWAEIGDMYAKLRFDVGGGAAITLTSGYTDAERGFGEYPDYDLAFDSEAIYKTATLTLDTPITEKTTLSLGLRTWRSDFDFYYLQMSTGEEIAHEVTNSETNGATAKFTWDADTHTLVIGSDYDENALDLNEPGSEEQKLEKFGVFGNDTVRIGGFSVTPGLRYEYTDTSGDFLSPSFGATYGLGKATILRLSVSRGFNAPPLGSISGGTFFFVPNPDLEFENVWSYQAGLESAALRRLWLKATLFRHDVKDAIVFEPLPDGTFTAVNEDRLRKQGIELEARTAPVYNISLYCGVVLQDADNLTTGEDEKGVPEQTVDAALEYDDKRSLRGSFRGHYIWWNDESSANAEYDDMIWDLNVSRKVIKHGGWEGEVFLTAHNIFNGSQYLEPLSPNPERWVEVGVRAKFF